MSNFANNDNITALFTATGTKIGERAKIFYGAEAEWNALPLSEKVKYDYTAFKGDSQSGIIDDIPTEDSENLVKSGGVFDAVKAVSDDVDGITDTLAKNVYSTLVDITSEVSPSGIYIVPNDGYLYLRWNEIDSNKHVSLQDANGNSLGQLQNIIIFLKKGMKIVMPSSYDYFPNSALFHY